MPDTPYNKTLQDELDWKLLDQLYGVVAQISSFCFETKKFCVTTEFVVLTLMVKFTQDSLDHSIFAAALVIPVCFWFLDATGYFYQVKMRGTMDVIRERLASRGSVNIVNAQGSRVIAQERLVSSPVRKVFNAAFNHSMWLYVILLLADLIVWWLYIDGRIR
jgi:hypothetical protein